LTIDAEIHEALVMALSRRWGSISSSHISLRRHFLLTIDRSWASITRVDTQLNAIKIHTTTPVYQKNASIMDQPPKFYAVILERPANGQQCPLLK
jgi:hypothetical protein